MSRVRYLVGDVRARIDDLPDASVALIVTSPPFLALRSYLPSDHPLKHAEIGSEPDPATFIDCLLAQVAQWSRVLAPWGSIAVELGDTYAGSGGAGGDYQNDGLRAGQNVFEGSARRNAGGDRKNTGNTSRGTSAGSFNPFNGSARRNRRVGGEDGQPTIQPAMSMPKPGTSSRMQAGEGWPLAKSACFIPELFGIALAYGINPLRGGVPAQALMDYIDMLTAGGMAAGDAIEHARHWLSTQGAPSVSPAGQWRVRNKIMWCRPNPPVGELGDKWRPATSMIVVATRDPRRWFDLDAVRVVNPDGQGVGKAAGHRIGPSSTYPGNGGNHTFPVATSNPAGAPPLDWYLDGLDGWDIWRMATQPYKGSHYATFPTELPRRLILSMCPAEVCRTCGEPRRRLTSSRVLLDGEPVKSPDFGRGKAVQDGASAVGVDHNRYTIDRRTVGWSDCGCGDGWMPAVVLDPFAGSGTTLAVAAELGRDAIGIDIDDLNVPLARRRIGEHVHVPTERLVVTGRTWQGSYRRHPGRRPMVRHMEAVCEPRLPRQKTQIAGQLNLLAGLSDGEGSGADDLGADLAATGHLDERHEPVPQLFDDGVGADVGGCPQVKADLVAGGTAD